MALTEKSKGILQAIVDGYTHNRILKEPFDTGSSRAYIADLVPPFRNDTAWR
jgi:hypothetical protein